MYMKMSMNKRELQTYLRRLNKAICTVNDILYTDYYLHTGSSLLQDYLENAQYWLNMVYDDLEGVYDMREYDS